MTAYYGTNDGTLSASPSTAAYTDDASYYFGGQNNNYAGIILGGSASGMVGWNIPTYGSFGQTPPANTPFSALNFDFMEVCVTNPPTTTVPFSMVIQTSDGFYHVASGASGGAPSGAQLDATYQSGGFPFGGGSTPPVEMLQGIANGFFMNPPGLGFNPSVSPGSTTVAVTKVAFIYYGDGTDHTGQLAFFYPFSFTPSQPEAVCLTDNETGTDNVSIEMGSDLPSPNPELHFNFEP